MVAGWKERVIAWMKFVYRNIDKLLRRFSALIWRLLEIHIFKAVALTIFLTCIHEVGVTTVHLCSAASSAGALCLQVCAINVFFVLLLAFGMPAPSVRRYVSHMSQVWCCLVILCKMIYQLRLVREEEMLSNCTVRRAPPPHSPHLSIIHVKT